VTDLAALIASPKFQADVRRWHATFYPQGCKRRCADCRARMAPAGQSLKVLQRKAINDAMARHGGNRAAVRRELGISKATLWRRLKEAA
jgi:transcriptional regulator with PAS, ATPase and Fis domain